MKNKFLIYAFLLSAALYVSSCSKFSTDNNIISAAIQPPVVPISDTAPLCGSISGTMLAGKTYNINGDIIVPQGDSLVIQPGAKLIFNNQSGLIVNGNLFSLGTQAAPIYFTVAGQVHTDNPVVNYNYKHDSAFNGIWKGVAASGTCEYLIFKWTHLEYCGANAGAGYSCTSTGEVPSDFYTYQNLSGPTKTSYPIYFGAVTGFFVFEDSWIYGTPDDAIRVGGGGGAAYFAIMRSTFEKCGTTGGDGVNVKAGGVGIIAYNMCIGGATNSLKASNKGTAAGLPTCNIDCYNNTIVNSGYRNTSSGKGGSINYEQGARGQAYNNLIVNCKYGLRLNGTLVPDTAFMYGNYGYDYYWADSVSVADGFIPYTPISVTKPVTTDVPNMASFLTSSYVYTPQDAVYNGTPLVQLAGTNPLFVNYPLPVTGGYYLSDICAIGPFNFNIQPASPCAGMAYSGFTPNLLSTTAPPFPLIDPKYGLTTLTLPGLDIGAYQLNGSGNQH
jgi:hypothetical protein